MEFSALWDSLPYSSPSTPNCSGAPLGEERFRGARFDLWAILAYWCALLWALFGRASNCNPALLSTVMSFRLRAVPLQSVESKLGRTGEGEMAERETGERPPSQLPLGFLFFAVSLASLDFLARVTILRDC